MLERFEKFQLVLLALILALGAFFTTKYATNTLSFVRIGGFIF